MTANELPKGKVLSLPKNWEVKKLGEVCEFFNDGNWIESKDQSEDGYRLIQTGNIGFGEFRNKSGKERYVSEETFKRLKCTEIFEGDILVSRLPDPVGRSCVIPSMNQKMITAVDCTIIRLKNRTIISDFFKYYSQSDLYFQNVREKITGTTRDRISRNNLGMIPIPIPPLPEQKRIVSIINKAFESISVAKNNAEKNLKNARELFDSYLNDVFTHPGEDWEEKKLGEVCEVVNGGTPKTSVSEYWNGSHLWITPAEMGKRQTPFVYETQRQLSDKGLKNSSAQMMPPFSVILSSRAPIGHLVINTKPMSTNQGCKGLVPKKNMYYMFLYYFLFSNVDYLNSLGTGATFKELSGGKLKEIIIPIPPLPEQQSIVEKLDALSAETKKLEAIYQQKLNDLDELKKSILDKAFKGEL